MKGLTNQEVQTRLKNKKNNNLDNNYSNTIKNIIISNIFTLFNLINIFLAILVIFTGEYTNLLFIFVIVINTIIAIHQEITSKMIIDNLKLTIQDKVTVIREGKKIQIDEKDIVIDDIIVLKQGEQAIVDATVITSDLCEVDESIITGESTNIIKKKDDKIYSGTIIVSGTITCKVIALGSDTYASKLVENTKSIKTNETFLRKNLNKILKLIMIIIIPSMILLFISSYYFNHTSLNQAILSTVAGVIGMIPSGLILLTSITSSVGTIKMAKKNVIIQKLTGIETLASIDTLCLDKTGTITDSTFSVVEVITLDKKYEINNIIKNMDSTNINETDKALDKYFTKTKNYKVLKKVPFSSYRKWKMVTFEKENTFILGALEYICQTPQKYHKYTDKYYEKGYRILTLMHSNETASNNNLPKERRVIAFIILKDNIRKNVENALTYFQKQGVDIKILSGDNPVTVSKIMKQINYEHYDKYIDCSTLPDDYYKIKEIVKNNHIFGRVTPYQKQQIIKILKEDKSVGMIGDGVNDILALKEADCSIALNSGIQAAKNVSQIVLIESDFTKLPDIVNEGRRVINNMLKVSSLYLVKTTYSFLLTILSILLSFNYPFYPIQLTLIGSLCVGLPSFILALEPNNEKVDKDNLKKVFAYSIPSGITVCINVLLLLLVTKIFHLNIENYKMALVASTGIINLIIINNISKNSTKIAKILLSICGITFILSLLIFYKILLLPKYNIYILLIIILYFIIDKYLIKYLKIAYENIILKNK